MEGTVEPSVMVFFSQAGEVYTPILNPALEATDEILPR